MEDEWTINGISMEDGRFMEYHWKMNGWLMEN